MVWRPSGIVGHTLKCRSPLHCFNLIGDAAANLEKKVLAVNVCVKQSWVHDATASEAQGAAKVCPLVAKRLLRRVRKAGGRFSST